MDTTIVWYPYKKKSDESAPARMLKKIHMQLQRIRDAGMTPISMFRCKNGVYIVVKGYKASNATHKHLIAHSGMKAEVVQQLPRNVELVPVPLPPPLEAE